MYRSEECAGLILEDSRPDSHFLTKTRIVGPWKYPHHPFPLALSKDLSAMPNGFVEAAMSTCLSSEMLRS